MRVALVTSDLAASGGGVKVVVEDLSRALVAEGAEVRVFGLATKAWRQGESAKWRGAPTTVLRAIGPERFGYAPRMAGALLDWEPEIVHVHGLWQHHGRSVLRWHRMCGHPYVVSPHGNLNERALVRSRLKKWVVGRLFVDQLLRSACAKVALTMAEARAIASCTRPSSVVVVPNGVDCSRVEHSSSRLPWAERTAAGEKVMLYLGRLHPSKNLAELIRAWAGACTRSPVGRDWHLVIAGWEELGHAAELEALCAKLGLSSTVTFAGSHFGEEKYAAFQFASALVLPSTTEGLPIAVLEAWSYGLPVLMTDACNLPEGFEANAAHRLSEQAVSMTRELITFWELGDIERRAMGSNGRALVERQFCWSQVARRMLRVYEACVHPETSRAVSFL